MKGGPTLQTRYLISFFVLGVVIIVCFIFIGSQINEQREDSRVVNIAGRQRMLSQKISKVAAELMNTNDALTVGALVSEMKNALAIWEQSQDGLRFGDVSLGLPSVSDAVAPMYADMDPEFREILAAGKLIVASYEVNEKNQDISSLAGRILETEGSFLQKMDATVFAHDAEASRRVQSSQFVVFFVNALLITFIFALWFFVVRPALKKNAEVDRAKTEFVSLASHQLRTPLSVINWYSEMLLAGNTGPLNAEQKKYLDEIYHSNHRMVELVNALLNVSRIELGTFSVEPEEVDVVELSKDVVHELKPLIRAKNLHVLEQYGKNLYRINIDPKLARIIFQNMVSNAVKYTPSHGSVTVSVDVSKGGEKIGKKHIARDSLVLMVSDSGIGIPAQQQQ